MKRIPFFAIALLLLSPLLLATDSPLAEHVASRMRGVEPQASATRHPLSPLTRAEISAVKEVLEEAERLTQDTRFVTVVLREPPKEKVLAWEPGVRLHREAFVVLLDRSDASVYEAVVDLTEMELRSWEHIEGVQAPNLSGEFRDASQLVRSHPEWRAAIRRRGITDLSRVWIAGWSPGYFGLEEEEDVRLIRAGAYYYEDAVTPYARPVEGVMAYVDVTNGRVLEVIDTGAVPLAPPMELAEREETDDPERLAAHTVGELTVEDGEVRWLDWRFRFSFQPRVGLVLQTVGYEDGGQVRPVLYQASLSEMLVPYADPSPTWFFRNALDAGEYGMGRNALQLRPGRECPQHALFFGATFANDFGDPETRRDVLCLFEHDGHLASSLRGVGETRELVARFISDVGNYDYGFDWIFHEDGRLAVEVVAMGIDQPKGVEARTMADESAAADTRFGELVAENIVAPYHQHFFSWRLDLDVDGPANNVVELNVQPLPPDERYNPWGNAFVVREHVFQREKEAQRDANPESARQWKVINPSVKNDLGHPVGYTLEPGTVAWPYAHPDSWIRRRARFADHHLWVTPYRPDERYAAGAYPNQSREDEGLGSWTDANRRIYNTDIVLWYTMGMTHVTQSEDWPVMPSDHLHFELLPTNFFDHNPTVDRVE